MTLATLPLGGEGGAFGAGSKWGVGGASPGPVSWEGFSPVYDPANFELYLLPSMTQIQKAGVQVHELMHFDQFVTKPWQVWYAQSWIPGSSIPMFSLESEAYRAQASFLGETYHMFLPFNSANMVNAAGRDLLWGLGAVGTAGALWDAKQP